MTIPITQREACSPSELIERSNDQAIKNNIKHDWEIP